MKVYKWPLLLLRFFLHYSGDDYKSFETLALSLQTKNVKAFYAEVGLAFFSISRANIEYFKRPKPSFSDIDFAFSYIIFVKSNFCLPFCGSVSLK